MLIGISSCFLACSSSKFTAEHIKGSYALKENEKRLLILEENTFVLLDKSRIDDLALHKCCDTLAYGKWKIRDKRYLELSTPFPSLKSEIDMHVKESSAYSKDSLYFFIENPIERHYKKFNEKYRELFYSIQMFGEDFYEILSDKNPILIPKKGVLNEFDITVYTKFDIPIKNKIIRELSTNFYKLNDSNSNVFYIELPQVSYSFLNYKRINKDYLRISNNGNLLWDGLTYLKN